MLTTTWSFSITHTASTTTVQRCFNGMSDDDIVAVIWFQYWSSSQDAFVCFFSAFCVWLFVCLQWFFYFMNERISAEMGIKPMTKYIYVDGHQHSTVCIQECFKGFSTTIEMTWWRFAAFSSLNQTSEPCHRKKNGLFTFQSKLAQIQVEYLQHLRVKLL